MIKMKKCLDIYKICAILYVKLETKMHQAYDENAKKHPRFLGGAYYI